MAEQPRPDDLAQLRAELAAQRTMIARLQRRRRLPRRILPLTIVALLVALMPLSLLAADPIFSDIGVAAPVHRANIQAIGNVGITTGFEDPNDPNARLYDPKGLVTREEMASFLARTAGLGTNPPVADAATLGGYAPNGLARVARATGTGTFTPGNFTAVSLATATYPAFATVPGVEVTIQVPGDGFVVVSAAALAIVENNEATIVRLRDTTPGAPTNAVAPTLFAAPESVSTVSQTWVFPVTGAGAKRFALEVAQITAAPGDAGYANAAITALFVPFGPNGGPTDPLP